MKLAAGRWDDCRSMPGVVPWTTPRLAFLQAKAAGGASRLSTGNRLRTLVCPLWAGSAQECENLISVCSPLSNLAELAHLSMHGPSDL